MSIIKKMRKQVAVLWTRTTPDKFGKFSFDQPVEITCRWEDTVQEFLSPQGEKQASRSVVYVDRIIAVGDRLKRGALDSTIPDDPMEASDAWEVLRFDQLPNLKNTETLYTAYL